MNTKPLTDYSFSFIIPVYNAERKLLDGCLNSIISQDFAKYEIIIVNDGSTLPEVEEICSSFAAKYGNIKYLVQKNQGSAVARNTGLDHASGEYVIFVDADDMLHENLHDKLSKIDGDFDILCMGLQRDYLNQKKLLTIPDEAADFSSNKDELYKSLLRFPEVLDNFYMSYIIAKCFSMKFLRENKLHFQPQLIRMQDMMFMLEACYAAKRIIYRPILCYLYITNLLSITRKMNFKMLDYCFRTYEAVQKWCDEHSMGWVAYILRKYFHERRT